MRPKQPPDALVRSTFILLLAIGLRVVGVAWGTPNPQYARSETARGQTNPQVLAHPDEFHFAARSYLMVATRDLNPHFFENPSFYINLNVLLHLISGDTGQYPPVDRKTDMRQVAPFTVYPMARFLTALMAMLGVAFTYAAGRRLFDTGTGLIAALILAVSFADVQHSHYATTNVPAGVMLCGSLWASLRLLQPNARRKHYVLSGLLVGLAGSSKYNVGLVGLVYALCGLYAVWRDRSVWRASLLGVAAVGLGFFIGTPYALFDPKNFLHDFLYITGQYIGGQGYPETNLGLPFHLLFLAWFGLGLVGTVLVAPGIWASLRPRRSRVGAAILLAFLIIYALVVLRGRRLGDHLLVPIIGPCALLTAVGAMWLYRQAGSRRLVAIVLVVLIVVIPLAYSLYFDRELTQLDTRQLAQEWIYQHIPTGTHVHLTGPFNVPLDGADYSTSQTFGDDQRPLSSIENAKGAAVLVVSDAISFLYNSSNYWVPADYAARLNAFQDQLTHGLYEVARFERPRWPGDDTMITTASYFHNPTITIYCATPSCDQPIVK